MKLMPMDSIADLRSALQTAIELEHATIPPYLTANFTLFETGNDQISGIIGSVLGEEMLHLSIACNVLNAIGGSPVLNKPGFIPRFPGPLPGSVEKGLIVTIEKFSKELVRDVFMEIETPEDPIVIGRVSMPEDEDMTIGQFYNGIIDKIKALEKDAIKHGKTIFTGDPANQMTYEKFYSPKLLYPVTDEKTAVDSINIIIDQGEGSTTSPFVDADADGNVDEVAHYYRFEEIYEGKSILPKPGSKTEYIFGAPEIPFHPEKVANMWPNPKMDDYPKDSLAYQNSKMFNYNYTSLLNSLHETFNGEPDKMNTALGIMFSLRLYALKLLAIPDPNHPGYVAGPSYEYVVSE